MYHVALRQDNKPKLNYDNLSQPKEKQTIQVPEDDSVPQAPDGFVFYRIVSGDTLVSLSVRFGVSQNKIRRYNNKVCFGHRLTHIVGKLLLIPVESTANLTMEMREQLTTIYNQDEEDRLQHDENIDDKKFAEPDENGKYQLKKALMFHAKGIDDLRALYYLGEANWNVRKALNLFREDDKWEKQRRVMNACKLTGDEAVQLLDQYHWKVDEAIRFYMNEQKKMAKINKKLHKTKGKRINGIDDNELIEGTNTTSGATEMMTMSRNKDEINENLINDNNDNDEYNNSHQASLTAGFCCN